MPKDKKPIYVKDKNDPRLKAYNDSLDAYKWSVNTNHKMIKTGKSSQGEDIDLNTYSVESVNKAIDDRYKQLKEFLPNISKKDVEEEAISFDPINKGTGKVNRAISYTTYNIKGKDNNSKARSANYAKPVQPYILENKLKPNYLPSKNLFVNNDLELRKPIDYPTQDYSKNNSEIITTPYYKIKKTKDNTGKVLKEEYLDFNDNPIEKMRNGGFKKYFNGGLTPQEQAYNQQQEDQMKGDFVYNTGKQGISMVPGIGTVVGGLMNVSDQIGDPIRRDAERTDEYGNLVNRNKATTGYVAGTLTNPYKSFSSTLTDKNASSGQKIANALTGGISNVFWVGKYADNLEKNAKDKIAIDEANQAELDALNNPTYNQPSFMEKYYGKYGGMMKCANGGQFLNIFSDNSLIHAPELGGYFRKKI